MPAGPRLADMRLAYGTPHEVYYLTVKAYDWMAVRHQRQLFP